MKIKVDYNFCLESVIGENGILYKKLEKLNGITDKIHLKIKDEREHDIVGFYKLPFSDTGEVKDKVNKFKENYKNCVVLGIGGSALGTTAVLSALTNFYEKKKVYVLDNIDPDQFYDFLNVINLKDSCFAVISKSGSTAETISEFLVIRKLLIERLGFDEYKKRIIVITDPVNGILREIAINENLESLSIPENVGGRFSVLSSVGLFPIAFAGIDIDLILEGAIFINNIIANSSNLFENPAYLCGALHYLSYDKGKTVNVFMPYSNKLYGLSDWFRQLWAESLGKNGKGAVPVKAIGATDQHSQLQLYMEGPKDKLITFLKIENFQNNIEIPKQNIHEKYDYLMGKSLDKLINSELDATRVALAKNGVPNYLIAIESLNPFVLGELIFMLQVMTHYTGYLFNINPFDQPGVELSKQYTYGILDRVGFEHLKAEYHSYMIKCSDKFVL